MMPRSRLCRLGLLIHITNGILETRLITDLMLSKFPIVLDQRIPLLSRHVLADVPIKPRE